MLSLRTVCARLHVKTIMGTAKTHFVNSKTTGKVTNLQPNPIQGHLNPRGRCDSRSSESPNYCCSYFFRPKIFHLWVFHFSAGLKGIVFMATFFRGWGGTTLIPALTRRKEREEERRMNSPKIWTSLAKFKQG